MPIKEDLLEILCCPLTKTPVRVLEAAGVAAVNARIEAGQVKYENGNAVEEPLEEALITTDGARIYAIKDGIPIMLVDESIPAAQLGEGFPPAPPPASD